MVNECNTTWPFTIFVNSSRGVVPGRISYSPALTAAASPFQRAYQTHARGCATMPCDANSAATCAKLAPEGTLKIAADVKRSGASRLLTPDQKSAAAAAT